MLASLMECLDRNLSTAACTSEGAAEDFRSQPNRRQLWLRLCEPHHAADAGIFVLIENTCFAIRKVGEKAQNCTLPSENCTLPKWLGEGTKGFWPREQKTLDQCKLRLQKGSATYVL